MANQKLSDRTKTTSSTNDSELHIIKGGVSYRIDKGDFIGDRVDNLEANQVDGVARYDALADLPATGVATTSYKVTADPTASNNGFYSWNGASYDKDAGLYNGSVASGETEAVSGDTVYQNTRYKTNAIVGKNKFDKSVATIGYRIFANGTIGASATYDISDYIPVTVGQEFKSNANIRYHAMFDSNKVVTANGSDTTTTTITIPSGVAYIRVTIYHSTIDTFQIEEGTTTTTYESYKQLINPDELDLNYINTDDLKKITNPSGYNLKRDAGGGVFSSDTGVLKIVLPFDVNSSWNTFEIDFQFDSYELAKLFCGGLAYTTPKWTKTQANLIGNLPNDTVRFGYDTTLLKMVIIIGEIDTVWPYTLFSISKWYASTADNFGDIAHSIETDISDVTFETFQNQGTPVVNENLNAGLLGGFTKDEIVNIGNQNKDTYLIDDVLIMGSSKSTFTDFNYGWQFHCLENLYNRINKVDSFTSNVTPTNFTNPRCYNDLAYNITGVASYFDFDIYGKEVNLFQAIRRTTDYAEYDIYVDDVKVAQLNNKNNTLGSDSDNFTTNGSQRTFILSHNDIYSVTATLDGSPITFDANTFIARTFNPSTNEVVKVIHFTTAPTTGQSLVVSYSVGHVICHNKTDFYDGATDDVSESFGYYNAPTDLNSDLGATGYVLMPNIVDERCVTKIKFDTVGSHTVKLVITGGTNPYLCLNFATNSYFGFVNASVGGWDCDRFLSDNKGGKRDYRVSRYIDPTAFLVEYGTNDDRQEIDMPTLRTLNMQKADYLKYRLKDVTSVVYNSGDTSYDVGVCTAIIDSITEQSITSSSLVGASVTVGDYVRIGTYYSSWREIQVRQISAFDDVAGTITWVRPIIADDIWHITELNDLVGKEFAVRDWDNFITKYTAVLDKIKQINPSTKILCLGQSNYNTNQYCSGWGQDEVMQELANDKGAIFIPLNRQLMLYEESRLTGDATNQHTITATGATEYQVLETVYSNPNRAFKVLVGGVDVNGIDCYVERLDGWFPNPLKSGTDLEISSHTDRVTTQVLDYNNVAQLKIVFYQNAPISGDIVLEWGDSGWTDDGIHPNSEGYYQYGNIIAEYFTK